MSPAARKGIGSFEIERELGQGGMGVVYLARQPLLDRPVVLKALRRNLTEDATLEERFRREAQAAASVHHHNVVGVYDCFTWRGERFIALEYVEGFNLSEVLVLARRLPARIAGLIACELVRGLEEIHNCRIVHRDLKPSNVLIGKDGEVKIADFGIALDAAGTALTQTGHTMGTPAYMSPEQQLGERADERSDLFSFGVVLYEMLTGELPFGGAEADDEALLRRIQAGRHTRPRRRAPETPLWLSRLVRRCLRSRAKQRPPSAAALRRQLEDRFHTHAPAECRREIAAWLWKHGVFATEDGETEYAREAPPRRRSRLAPLGLAGALTAAAAAGGGLIGLDPTAPPHPAGPEQAWIHIDAPARTEVRIDGGVSFRAPQEGLLRVTPGAHHVTFSHPVWGTAERRIEIAAGEQRRVRHSFDMRAPFGVDSVPLSSELELEGRTPEPAEEP